VLLADLFSFEDALPYAVFGAFAALAWWVLELVATGKSRSQERLDEFANVRAGRRDKVAAGKRSERMAKMLEKATPALQKSMEPKSEAEISRLKARLSYAGFRAENAGAVFLGIKGIGLMVGLFFGGSFVIAMWGVTLKSMAGVLGIVMVALYLPEIVLWFMGKNRRQAVFLGLPDALDLLVVCVEAGLGVDQAMRKVADEMAKSYPIVAEEFGLSNFQLQMGRSRGEVLHELGLRTGVKDLRALASVLIQADKFGSSVAQALRVQSDSMRIRRRQLAEEKAAKTAVKLIFPLVMFIFPGIFVILVGPAAITMVRELFPKMAGR
jgi:tight adherence protein C